MSITKEDIASVKSRGFLLNRGTECFSGRVVSIGGVFSADALTALAECARLFGSGAVIFTSRLSAEVQGIPFTKIPEAEAYLAERGLYFGGTGAKVRPITACKGTTCVFGNIDTHAIAKELHERFYIGYKSVKLPHKFKIGVGGCPNSCMKQSLNDVGIEGARTPSIDADICRGCKVCRPSEACPHKAITKADGERASINFALCRSCGVCLGKCPFSAIPENADSRVRIYVGGTWGKTQRVGTPLPALYDAKDIGDIVEKIMLWYKKHGFEKERLGATVDRLGIDRLTSDIEGNLLLNEKKAILASEINKK